MFIETTENLLVNFYLKSYLNLNLKGTENRDSIFKGKKKRETLL